MLNTTMPNCCCQSWSPQVKAGVIAVLGIFGVAMLVWLVGEATRPEGNAVKAVQHTPSPTNAATVTNAIAVERPNPINELASLEAYFAALDRLREGPAETAEFNRKILGQDVLWEGAVAQVSEAAGGGAAIVLNSTNQQPVPFIMAFVPKSLRDRTLALQSGDRLRIAATFTNLSGGQKVLWVTNFWVNEPTR